MIVEVFLILSTLTISYNIYKTKRLQKRLYLLEGQNDSLVEAIVNPLYDSDANYYEHSWEKDASKERVSIGKFSVDAIYFETRRCNKCNMIHRFISKGLPLVKNNNIIKLEGFYNNGIRCQDNGCKPFLKK